MPSATDTLTERLQQEVPVERLVEGRGVSLQPRGDVLLGRCPFHGDEGPPLQVTPATNRWACEVCGEGGPVEWVMRAEGVSRRHAVELLSAEGPLQVSDPQKPLKVGTVRKLPSPLTPGASDAELLSQVADYYHQTLAHSPEALAYLSTRGLNHPELVDTFRLGISNRTLGLRLPLKNRKAGDELRSRLQALGILRDTGHEHFRGSLVVPVLDASGEVVQLYGRKVGSNLRPVTPLHTYLPGGPRGVWNLQGLEGQSTVILCGSLLDGLTVWCAGFRNVTATQGLEGFTDEYPAAFRAAGVERVLLAFRQDEAGEQVAREVAEKLHAHGLEALRVPLPPGMDVNDFAQRVESPARALAHAFENAASFRPSVPLEPVQVSALAEKHPAPIPMETAQGPARTPEPQKAPSAQSPAPNASPAPAQALPEVSPAVTPTDTDCEVRDDEVHFRFGDRRFRVRGLGRNTTHAVLKVNLLVSRDSPEGDAGFHVDTLDLYVARQRTAFLRQASSELGLPEDVLRHDLGRILFRLEGLQEEALRRVLEPKKPEVVLTQEETAEAMELLRAPDLAERLLQDLERCGVVGEETNKLMGYLAAVSRKLEEPLAIVIQSSSAAGKSSLMEAVLAFVPEEDRKSSPIPVVKACAS